MRNKYLKVIVPALLFMICHSCSYENSAFDSANADSGTGGSMARFTIVDDHLFTVDNENISSFDISSIEAPEFMKKSPVGFGIETIFPLGDKLFLGTSSGMYIYEISGNGILDKISFYEHVVACDPVVSDGKYAYVTLSSGRPECWNPVNELQIVDLQDLKKPLLIKQYQMTNPLGLAVKNDTLWVCDNGLKVFDVSDIGNIDLLYHFDGIRAYDVILDDDRALVIGESGFVQYKVEDGAINKLSEIRVEPEFN